MNHETEIKLQAFVDGKLPPSESQEVIQLLEDNSEARALCDELRRLKTLFSVGEPDVSLPVNRVFYWSKIEKAITSENFNPGPRTHGFFHGFLPRFALPVIGGLLLVLFVNLLNNSQKELEPGAGYAYEVEASYAEENSFTFHSEVAAMTIVWVDSNEY